MKQRFSKRPKPKTANNQIAAQTQLKLQQALTWHQQGQLALAQVLYEEILTVNPNHLDALHLLGAIAAQTKNLHRAVALFDKTIEINPDNASYYFNRALALHELKQLDAALADYDKVIAIEHDSADAYFYRGNALKERNQLDAALASYDKAIAINQNFAGAYYNRGNTLKELKQLDTALASYDRAIAIKPDYAEAYNNRGLALQELKQFNAALANYDRAIAIEPDFAGAHYNRGKTLKELKQLDAALASYDKAIAIKPDYAEAYNNRGIALHELKQLNAALANYDRSIALKPDYAEAYNNRGIALHDLMQLEAALASYDKAIAIKPDCAEAHNSRGYTLSKLKQYQAAIESYNKALAIEPDYGFLCGMLLHSKMQICDWSDTENLLAELIQKIQLNEKASPPGNVLALSTSLPLQRKAAEIYAKVHPVTFDLGNLPKRIKGAKIRIGYFSMDFRNHPVSFLTAELFETHDRNRFEVIAFSFGPDTQDEMRQRLEGTFDKFIDVSQKSDKQIAELARLMEIDIAIDLAGYTAGSRPGIFAFRAAPIQVNYLGYIGTLGADYIDYLIADKTLIPEESQQYYSEKIIYLPNSFQVNDTKRKISDKEFTREELGLPASGFVFCCFNNNYKITPSTFDGWMRILKRVEGSVLWLFEDTPTAADNLRKEAAQRGVDAQRLVFAKRMPLAEHLARYRVADLFIDTLPCNAGTTASDALWVGLPVLTCTGEAYASRVAASLLTAIDLPELIVTTQEDYEDLAVELATNPEQLKTIKQKLARNRLTTPLFDTKLFTKHIDDAYTQIYERYHADLPPDNIYVESK